MNSAEIFDSIFAKNNAHAMDLINDLLQQKAYNLIQQRKDEVAQNYFNSSEE